MGCGNISSEWDGNISSEWDTAEFHEFQLDVSESGFSSDDGHSLQDNPKIQSVEVIIPLGAAIYGNAYLVPEEVVVVLGGNNTVTWINQDETAHGIASDKGGDGSWGSGGVLEPGESFSVTFNRTGIFEYHGVPHPWETGRVIVLEG